MDKLVCDLCGSTDLKFICCDEFYGKLYSSYKCRECGLQQTLGDVEDVSPEYVSLRDEDITPDHTFLQNAHKFPAFKQMANILKKHSLTSFAGARLLDIGCGVGGFLRFAEEQGFLVHGFDASEAHVSAAEVEFESVRCATSIHQYHELLGRGAEYDVITLWDVFEHIRDPEALLHEIHSHLSKSGFLYLSIPSAGPNEMKIAVKKMLGRTESGLIPWEHVFYYTESTIRTRLERAGFEVLEVSGVAPYVRYPLSVHEVVRRLLHVVLRRTRYAPQIFCVARKG